MCKIKEGHSKSIDTYETHVFMAINRKLSREPLLINGTPVFHAFAHKQGDKHVEVEIRKPTGIICISAMLSELIVFYDLIIKRSCIKEISLNKCNTHLLLSSPQKIVVSYCRFTLSKRICGFSGAETVLA